MIFVIIFGGFILAGERCLKETVERKVCGKKSEVVRRSVSVNGMFYHQVFDNAHEYTSFLITSNLTSDLRLGFSSDPNPQEKNQTFIEVQDFLDQVLQKSIDKWEFVINGWNTLEAVLRQSVEGSNVLWDPYIEPISKAEYRVIVGDSFFNLFTNCAKEWRYNDASISKLWVNLGN